MHKIIHAMTLAALAAISLASGPAQASYDTKSISTSLCRPLTAPDATGLVFDTRGVVNSTTVNKRVICSILKDAEAAYSPTVAAYIFQYFAAGSIDGSVNCTYYLGPVGYPGIPARSYTANGSASAGSSYNTGVVATTYPSSGGYDNVGTTAVCTLSGKTTLAFFTVSEYGATNTP